MRKTLALAVLLATSLLPSAVRADGGPVLGVDLQAALPVGDFGDDALAIRRNSDVGPNEDRRPAGRRDRVDDGSPAGLVAAGHGDPGALLREEEGRRLADARRGSGDDRDAVFELHDVIPRADR